MRYRRKADAARLILPGHGLVSAGRVLDGDYGALCPAYFEEIHEEASQLAKEAPKAAKPRAAKPKAAKASVKPKAAPRAAPKVAPKAATEPVEGYASKGIKKLVPFIHAVEDWKLLVAIEKYEKATKKRSKVLSAIAAAKTEFE